MAVSLVGKLDARNQTLLRCFQHKYVSSQINGMRILIARLAKLLHVGRPFPRKTAKADNAKTLVCSIQGRTITD
jgi:hypothetical protein